MTVLVTPAEMRDRLRSRFAWRGDRWDRSRLADVTGWWRDAVLLAELGPALAALFADAQPTVVLGLQSRGCLLGALTAQALGVGFVEVRKEPNPAADSDEWVTATTPPDYRDRHLVLGFPRRLVTPEDRVLLVDDWVDTGGQALGAQKLVTMTRATWLGMAVVVDDLANHQIRRELSVRALIHGKDL